MDKQKRVFGTQNLCTFKAYLKLDTYISLCTKRLVGCPPLKHVRGTKFCYSSVFENKPYKFFFQKSNKVNFDQVLIKLITPVSTIPNQYR